MASETIDRVRGSLEGMPGFLKRQTTVKTVIPIIGTTGTYIAETVRAGLGAEIEHHLFVDAITPDGTVRLYLPPKVLRAIYAHRESLIKSARKLNGLRLVGQQSARA